MDVEEGRWLSNGPSDEGQTKFRTPPFEILVKVSNGMMWHERTTTANSEHGLQCGEISTSRWDDQARVQEFPIESLYVPKDVHFP